MSPLVQIAALAGSVAAVLGLRTTPLLLFALASPRFDAVTKLLALATYAAVVGLALSADPTFLASALGFAIGFAYFAACACILVWMCRADRLRALSPAALVALLAFACIVLPGCMVNAPGGLVVLMTGWELFFSSYSYTVESKRPQAFRSLGEGLFFLLVNPSLSYPERGAWSTSPDVDAGALRRCATGAALLFLQALSAPLGPLIARIAATIDVPWVAGYVAFALGCAIGLGRAFLAQAGVAHVHIGLLALMGFRARERFDAPWRSTSPADFWRRWNVYLGVWFRRYVFNPAAYRLARLRRVSPLARTAAALLFTFVLAGIAHDAIWLVQYGTAGNGVLAFGAAGLAVMVGETAPLRAAASGARGLLARWTARALSWHLVFVSVWLFGFMLPR